MNKLIFILSLYFLAFNIQAASVVSDGFYFEINKDAKTAIVTSITEDYTGDLIIPSEITYQEENYKVTSIGRYAFSECKRLTGSLVIPKGITSIGDYAFNQCSNLTGSLVIPEGVVTIGNHAFNDCNGFTGSLIISLGTTEIGPFAFNGCSNLTGSLVIPEGVAKIGEYAFNGCTGFNESLVLNQGIVSIGNLAFNKCSGLKGSLTLPEGLLEIGNNSFYKCTGFDETLTLPKSLLTIGTDAFAGSINFKKIISLNPIPPQITSSTLSDLYSVPLFVPHDTFVKYKSANYWKNFLYINELNDPHSAYSDDEVTSILLLSLRDEISLVNEDSLFSPLFWESTNENIATVNDKGFVNVSGFGHCYIISKDAEGNDVDVFSIFACPNISIEYSNKNISYSHHVVYNSMPTLFISAPEGFVIKNVYQDDIDITDSIKKNDGYYRPEEPITTNTNIKVLLESTKNPADLNGDGKVDTSDLNWLLEHMMNF